MFLSVLTLVTVSVGGFAATITVPDDYLTIQAAIDAAQLGDTVYVRAGVYKENLVIDKPLSIIGEDRTTTTIRSLDPEDDVIRIILSGDAVALARIKTSYGDIGLNVHVEAGAQVTLSDVIVSENQIGIRAFGEGDVAISGSCAVGNSYANAMLGAAAVDVQDSEFLLSFVGIVLVGNVEAILSQNIIGLGKSGLLTYTQSCGFNFFGVPQTFTGKVSGVGNRVYGHMLDLCPSHEFWPDEFVDTNWRLTIWRVLMAPRWKTWTT